MLIIQRRQHLKRQLKNITVNMVLHSFPYRDYDFKIEYDEGFFRFTELKDITSRDFRDIPFEFEAVVVGVDPYKDQTISEMEVGYTSDYIRYLKGMAEEPPKDVNTIKFKYLLINLMRIFTNYFYQLIKQMCRIAYLKHHRSNHKVT